MGRLLLLAAVACAAAQQYTYPVSDTHGLGRPFLGIGAISGGGATSRLLLDYQEPYRSQVLDFLFKPNFGAALQILKVEIGSSADSTNGAEAPHRYSATEEPVWTRGYEWWLINEAKKRNPDILLYGLPWGFPGFLAGPTGSPFDNVTATAAYIAEWGRGLKDVYGWTLDYQGLWNEKPFSADYTLALRQALDDAGLTSTKIVASDDGGWPAATAILENSTLADAVFALGSHYPGSSSSPQAIQTGKPLFASEDNSRSSLPGQNGGACWARVLNENQAHGNMSGSISWSLINSWYSGIEFYGDGLMLAVEPWSGNYYVGAPIWSSAHYSQFSEPGWSYLQRGSGVGYLMGGGTYTTMGSPDKSQWSIVVEKLLRKSAGCNWSSNPPNNTTPEVATFELSGSLAGISSLHAWYSQFDVNGNADPDTMFAYKGTVPVVNGQVTLNVAVGDLWTLSTVSTANKGSYATPPASEPFPLPWADNMDNYNLTTECLYLSDMNGNFEIVDSTPTGRAGKALRQMTPTKPILWLRADTTPHAIIGDPTWNNVTVTVDVYIPQASGTAAVAGHCYGLNVDNTSCLWFVVAAPNATAGGSGSWSVFNAAGNFGRTPLLSGSLPANNPLTVGSWHTIGIAFKKDNAALLYDGKALQNVSVAATASPATGFAGIGTAAYGHFTIFDNLAIEPSA